MKDGWKMALDSFLSNPIGKYFNDLYLSSRAIYWSMGMGVIYCFAFIYLMSAFAETIAWICVVLIQLGLIGLAGFGWFQRGVIADQAMMYNMQGKQLEDNKSEQNMYLAICIIGAILAAVFMCAVVCGFKSLKLAIDTIDAAADFLATTKRILFVPFLYFILTIIVLSVWLSAFACVASMNKITADTSVIPQAKDLKWED